VTITKQQMPTTFENLMCFKPCHLYKVVIVSSSIHISSKVWMKSQKHPTQGNCSHKLVMLGWWERNVAKMDGLHNPQDRPSQIGHINHVRNYIAIIKPLTLTCRVRPQGGGVLEIRGPMMMMRQQWSPTQWLV
jgi:hypothetical protein